MGNVPQPRIPVSTYRIQFSRDFKFRDAASILPYLYELGITDIYSSPYFKAKEGSSHGYDIVDPNALNPELGTLSEYEEFSSGLKRYCMGQILDIVPNHMCIEGKENLWCRDILENGPGSPYASFFDIDWKPLKQELANKILLPILGDRYGKVLENRELSVGFEEGAFFVSYYDHRLPVMPATYNHILGHRLDVLRKSLSEHSPVLAEILSIMTALRNLPCYTETDCSKVIERRRETEIIKRRLQNLYMSSTVVRKFILENLSLFNGVNGDANSFDLLDNLLNQQAYRLSFWRVATHEINYRRFFDINTLAAIQVEKPEVFQATHRLVLDLIREDRITGLRVDHTDGLYDPVGYFHMLQKGCFTSLSLSGSDYRFDNAGDPSAFAVPMSKEYELLLRSNGRFKPFYVIGEKILIKDEKMPDDWPIHSTTGYVFLNAVNGLFIRMDQRKTFTRIYEWFTKREYDFQELLYEKKKYIMEVAVSSEINTLGHYLNRLSEKDRHAKDFTLNNLTEAIREIIASFPVYRTYVNGKGASSTDRRYIRLAVSRAARRNGAISSSIFDFIRNILLQNYPAGFSREDQREWRDFTMRFQQLSGPVMAKGLEDTVFYVFNRFISLNEVGGSPDRFGISLKAFHGKNMERAKFWPHALITTSTHDTKRSEDVRARLNVISELPDEWRRHLAFWRRANRDKKTIVSGRVAPAFNEEYLIYQTLLGAWPLQWENGGCDEIFSKRIKDFVRKALREAKENTSWITPDLMYENALTGFIDRIMEDHPSNHFLRDFLPFERRVARLGLFNSLSQTVLKMTSPGVPDFYQGTELWDFSLVDPDNRRPVDFGKRTRMLGDIKEAIQNKEPLEFAAGLFASLEDGMIKLYTLYKTLNYRRDKKSLFERGSYVPIYASGQKSDHVCCFIRNSGNMTVIIAVPRFIAGLMREGMQYPSGAEVWGNTFIPVPSGHAGRYRNIFTEEIVKGSEEKEGMSMLLSEIFAHFPVALLEKIVED